MNRAAQEFQSRTCERGFTIIELLVSLTILSVILGLLAAGLGVISKNWDVNAKRIDTLDMVSRAVDILRRDAAGMQRVVDVEGRRPRFIFTGAADQLAFVTLEPPYPTAAGPYFVSYSVVANGPNFELLRERAPYRQNMQAFPGATPANRVPLLQGPYQYRFSYAQKSADGGGWHDTWPDDVRLPDLVRLQIIDPRSRKAISPPIVVGIRADAEVTCLGEQPGLCSAKTNGKLTAGLNPMETAPADK